jgi:hypothetical protein
LISFLFPFSKSEQIYRKLFDFFEPFFSTTGVRTQGFVLTKQVLYHLGTPSAPFALVILE